MIRDLIELAGKVNATNKPNTNGNAVDKLLGNAADKKAALNRTLPTGMKRSQPEVETPKAPVVPVEEPSVPDVEDTYTEDGAEVQLKARFIEALTAHCKATLPLSEVVAEMIAADIDRDEAVDWGIEAGLSEGYVRSTVSSLYIALTGKRQVKAGGGRKANKGARAMAIRALKECETVAEAKALLLAARRTVEKWEKAGTIEKELAKG